MQEVALFLHRRVICGWSGEQVPLLVLRLRARRKRLYRSGDPREARTHRTKKISASTNQRDADVSDSERRSEGDPDGAGVIRLRPHQLFDMSGMFYTQEINSLFFFQLLFSLENLIHSFSFLRTQVLLGFMRT